MLSELLASGPFDFLVVFARLGSAFVILPGFGEAYVAPRLRLVVAVAVTLAVTPMVADRLPALPGSLWTLSGIVGAEIGIGLLIGSIARILLLALSTAGTAIALQTSLANALSTDPASAQQSAIVANFLMALGLILVFVTNLHHHMLRALVDSYAMFPPGGLPDLGDVAAAITRTVADSFTLSVQVAAPFLVVGTVFYVGLGLLARLMPQVQVFFIAMPLQVLLGLFLLMLTLSAGMLWFLDRFDAGMSNFAAG